MTFQRASRFATKQVDVVSVRGVSGPADDTARSPNIELSLISIPYIWIDCLGLSLLRQKLTPDLGVRT